MTTINLVTTAASLSLIPGPSVLTMYEIVGIIVTLGSAAIAYIRAAEGDKNRQAALVSTLGLIFTILLSIRYDLLPKVNDHLAIAESIAKDSELTQVMQKVSAANASATTSQEPLMQYIEQLRLRSFEAHFNNISEGRFDVDESEMPEFALAMVKSSNKSILATSYVQVQQWWDTPWGKRYEDLNRDAIRRHVTVTRIFIFSNATDLQNARTHMQTQEKDGIKVEFAMSANLPMKVTSDMIVIDDRLAGELRLTPEKGMKEAIFYTKTPDIAQVQNGITAVENQSESFENSPPPKN